MDEKLKDVWLSRGRERLIGQESDIQCPNCDESPNLNTQSANPQGPFANVCPSCGYSDPYRSTK